MPDSLDLDAAKAHVVHCDCVPLLVRRVRELTAELQDRQAYYDLHVDERVRELEAENKMITRAASDLVAARDEETDYGTFGTTPVEVDIAKLAGRDEETYGG